MNNKLNFPATGRNSTAILDVLHDHLPKGNVLEIASGSGQHVVYFGQNLPDNTFFPSDVKTQHINSIHAWNENDRVTNVRAPVLLDVMDDPWKKGHQIGHLPTYLDAILCINMVHIAPIEAAHGLFVGANLRLDMGGLLYLYGPFLGMADQDAPSNLEFDLDLKCRNARWGVRRLEQIQQIARKNGFLTDQTIKMPANNFSVLFRKQFE